MTNALLDRPTDAENSTSSTIDARNAVSIADGRRNISETVIGNTPARIKKNWFSGVWSRRIKLPMIRMFEAVVLRKQAERFYSFFGGHILFETLRAATKFDLFSLLSERGPMTRKEIADALGVQEQPVRVMLLGLTTGGLLRKRGERYSNTFLGKQLLTKNSDKNVLSYVELQHAVMYKGVYRLYESILEGRNAGLDEFEGNEPTLYQRLAHDPNTEEIFQLAMRELSVQSNKHLAEYIDFSNTKHVVDVGGGDGTNAISLVRRWPHLRVTVFDSPTVCEIAKQSIRDAGYSDQIDTQSGDCFKDEFPRNADCFLFSHFFTIWSPEKDQELLRKSFEALPAGGKVILYNMMQNDDESGPWAAAIGSPYFLAVATGEGMLYTWKEYEDWMKKSGFSDIARLRLPRHQGAIYCRKPG